jgi:4-amino-4-deoxy-L-arabinose transferase-like glycosyltransferase
VTDEEQWDAGVRASRPSRPSRMELVALLAILVLAAVLRLPGLDVRGAFDADQGQDMLVLAGILRGDLPSLGPPTSIGTFHHGAAYYYALAPAVLLLGPDPVAVMGWIALWGVAAVAATWWLGHLLGGPAAAIVAGLLMALSPAGIDASTFIWNPNIIPAAAALAYAGSIHAWRSGSARWWLLAGAGAMVTMQAHILGLVILPPLVVAWLADVRRAGAEGRRRSVLGAGAAAGLIIAAGYVPLAIHELGAGFSELRAIGDYIGGDGRGAASGVLDRLVIVAMRSVVWPFAGLLSADPVRSLVALLVVVISAAIALLRGTGQERRSVAFVLGSVGWAVLALAIAAPSLAVIVAGLPNDHYHAFLDPLLVAVVGAGIARLVGAGSRPAAVAAGMLLVVFAAVAIPAWPPAESPDGGWRAAERDAATIAELGEGEPYALVGLPQFKTTNAVRFPLERLGVSPPGPDALAGLDPPRTVVVVCDPLFESVMGNACGGPAERAWLDREGFQPMPVATVEGGSRRIITSWRIAR